MQRNYVPEGDDVPRLAALQSLAAQLRTQEEEVRGQVLWLRSHDVPWRSIAECLGVTLQAAQQRYGGTKKRPW